ncbi:MAG: phosphonate C-P lyase system protein PhnH, partial [Chromatiales bacterium]|nr:phosphonate C-P lyase system protein PhnH [Chromatiales bacterium]
MSNTAELISGFADPVRESQQVFRQVLDAMSRPGTIVTLEPVEVLEPLSSATQALALALFDYETPVWLPSDLLAQSGAWQSIKFHTGCPVTADPTQ